jgi:NAD(P)-dependent dehydrogenase (short-subunit alcohol dehydrogenase family)
MSSPHPTSGIPRTVLVTGAARRLGREIALAMARARWQVAIHCRNSREEAEVTARDCAEISGHPSAVFVADLSVESEVRQLLPRVIEHFGSVNAVVNNACLFEQDTHETFSFEGMESHMRSNTSAAILLAGALHAHLHQAKAPTTPSGVVINMLDQKLWNPNPDFLSYTLSKAALEAANTLLAQALAPMVRVVGIAPGLTLTSHLLSEDAFAKMHKLSPLGRSSTPEDVAATVVFACSNSSITGTTLLVDGGQHLHRFDRDFSMMELN